MAPDARAAVSPPALLTLEEWEALPEDEPGEFVDGRLVEEEEVGYGHEVTVIWLGHVFQSWLHGKGGFVGASDARFVVRPTRGRKPDLTVYLPGSRVPRREGLVRVPPDIAVEIISATPRDSRRDRVEKTPEYADFGAKWYWLVDPQLRTLEILELKADGFYAHVLGALEGKVEAVPGCPGLTVDLDALWGELDRLEREAAEEPPEAAR